MPVHSQQPDDDPEQAGRPAEPREYERSVLWGLAGGGLELAAGVAVFTLLGWWLDGRFGTDPWLLVTGGGIGIVGGTYNLWKQVRRFVV